MSDDKTIPASDEKISEDHPVYHPPSGARQTDELDADVDGTSASHYGTNDPAQFEDSPQQKDR